MRYLDVEDIQFTNVRGETKTLHAVRQESSDINVVLFQKPAEMEFDDVAAKYFGANMVAFAYRLRDNNIERLLVNNFNEKAVQNVRVPVGEY